MKRVTIHPPRESDPTLWRSLAEKQASPDFATIMQREFSPGAQEKAEASGLSKREFLKLMGASLAFAGVSGLAGCRRPEAYLVPFNRGAEWEIPGKFLYYATAMPIRQGAMPLVIRTVDGRPIKVEGNPLHPSCRGATDGFAQASILDLYDPHRSKEIKKNGLKTDGAAFEVFLKDLAASPKEGLAFLVERKNSPTRDRLRAELAGKFPGLLWCEYEPLGEENAAQARRAAFGPNIQPVPKFERADVILALDSEFLNPSDKGVNYAAGFFPRRNPDQKAAPMNRLYVVENHYTPTGGLADHRYRCPASLIGEFTRQLGVLIATATVNPALAAVLANCPSTPATFDAYWLGECAADLLANVGRCLVTIGAQQPRWAQALVLALNEALGNHNTTIVGVATAESPAHSLDDLASAIIAGAVRTLFILGGNPAYNAPADLQFGELLGQVPEIVRWSLFEDETSRHSTWQVPAAHYLESWGDVRTFDGTYTAIQPMILPLWQGLAELELLAILAGRPILVGPELIKETLSQQAAGADWDSFLRHGFLPDSQWPDAVLTLDASALAGAIAGASPVSPGDLELVFLQSSSVDDGRYANNSWLQETPDFETKVTWDNVALMSAATAKKLGVRADNLQPADRPGEFDIVADMIEITAGADHITAAALVAPGHADDSISLALGYGRAGASAVMDNVGFNAYPLRTARSPRFRTAVTVRVTDRTYPLARTQEHQSMEGRDLFREGTLEQYNAHPKFAREMDAQDSPPPDSALPDRPPLTGAEQWGLAVDLNTCLGCNACLLACQAENNVPVVGKEQVRKNRDMAWIRIDRYFSGSVDNPEMLAQPVMCQQCENAPCETVCPVNATVHSEEGLNLMVYNRCIGTRYCANNCPWKVRRFNYFDYNERPLDELYAGPAAPKGMADSLKMVKNPNVTVRMRGVMEKCTFCIQRIEEAKIARLVEAGPQPKDAVPIREIQTACQQACPSDSLVFGNINDPHSRVARLRGSDRGYAMLKYLNARPRVTYLARVKNPNPRMPDADLVGRANGPAA